MRILIFIIILSSCGSETAYNEVGSFKSSAPTYTSGTANEGYFADEDLEEQSPTRADENVQDRDIKIIKDGQINLEVEHIFKVKIHIDSILSKYKAYYSREQFDKTDYQATYSLEIRVPSLNFEKLIGDIENGEGDIKSKNINANDVTESYYDIAIRLENKRAYLLQYKVLLKRANSIKDILEIQEKIRRLEEEIDSSVGRLRYMDDKVNFSTLTLQVYQTYEQKYEPQKRRFGSQMARSFRNGFEGFLDFTLGLVSIWPFILILLGLFVFRKKINFRFWKKKK